MPSRHDKMTAAAVWLAEQGAMVGWGPAADGKAVNRKWKSDMTGDPALVPGLLHGAKNSIIVPRRRLVIVDIDKYGWYERLVAAGLPDTFTVESPTLRPIPDGNATFRGRHVYTQAPDGYDVLSIPGVWKGGETRRSLEGEQSMVLGPWSLRTDGIYEPAPGTPRLVVESPASVFDFIIANSTKTSTTITVVGDEDGDWRWDGASMGSRHDHLRDRVRAWRGFDDEPDSLKRRLVRYIEKHAIPLTRDDGGEIDDAELDRMILGAIRKYDDDAPSGPIVVPGKSDPGSDSEEAPEQTESDEPIVIDPLAIESRIERPEPLVLNDVSPLGLAMLLDHFRPLTDAPFSSLALTSCVVMSALVGTEPTLAWRGKHRAALFGVLVGHSGYGRKGATMREVETAFRQVDPLLDDIEVSGIGSGEVLVDILNESKQNTIGTSLIWEHEIANVLVLAAREGNIMSGNLRRAWDGDAVQSRSRAKGKSVATGYNVAFMGGVTPSELEKRLTANDIANGWANRFLWFHSEKRPEKYDPTADHAMAAGLIGYLRDCIQFARTLGGSFLIKAPTTMSLTPRALARMEAMAEALDIAPVGAIGALRQRMPAHVIRLAMIAAIFDQTRDVNEEHVAFGERMTGYAIDSMRAVFGLRVDDPVAMLILSVLAQVPDGWMNTTTLKQVTGKEYSRVQSALRVLIAEGLVVREERLSGGRPAVGYRRTVGL